MTAEEDARRVVIVEDNAEARKGLRALLHPQTEIVIVAEAYTAEEAVAKIAHEVPDIALFDIKLPLRAGGKDEIEHGITAIRQVAEISPHTRILVRSYLDDSQTVADALGAGAHGYISKGDAYNGKALVDAMLRIIRGEVFVSQAVARHIRVFFNTAARATAAQPEPAHSAMLTPREREVLDQLMLGHTNAQIAHELSVTVATVKSHVSNILFKYQRDTRQEVIEIVRRQGGG